MSSPAVTQRSPLPAWPQCLRRWMGSRLPQTSQCWGLGGMHRVRSWRETCTLRINTVLSLWILASIPFPELDLLCNHFSRAGNWHPLGSHKDFSAFLLSPPCLPHPLPAEQPLTHSFLSLSLEAAAPPLRIDKACPRNPGRPMSYQVSMATVPSLPVLTGGSPLP